MKARATHEDLTRTLEVEGSSNRAFGFVFASVFVLIGAGSLLRGGPARPWALAVAAVFLGLAVLYPRALAPLNRLWMRLGMLLQRVTSPIVLGLLFYGTITPIGLLMRMLGKTPLRLAPEPGARTYWIERRPPGPSPPTMRDQF
ncbi:MAG TPA: SxtJ family membrane protein [Candidatus Limnocylindrales bacterium]|nr:SxtJ family membrane protein [Candidatus Limnocylindrales bacterium]